MGSRCCACGQTQKCAPPAAYMRKAGRGASAVFPRWAWQADSPGSWSRTCSQRRPRTRKQAVVRGRRPGQSAGIAAPRGPMGQACCSAPPRGRRRQMNRAAVPRNQPVTRRSNAPKRRKGAAYSSRGHCRPRSRFPVREGSRGRPCRIQRISTGTAGWPWLAHMLSARFHPPQCSRQRGPRCLLEECPSRTPGRRSSDPDTRRRLCCTSTWLQRRRARGSLPARHKPQQWPLSPRHGLP